MSQIGYSTLAVVPGLAGFGKKLSSGIAPEMRSAGIEGGKHFGSGLSSGAMSIGKGAGKIIGVGIVSGLAVAIAGISAVIKTGFGEVMDASKGTAQLAAGIKSTGNAAGVSVKSLNDLASSIQGYSGQTDDSIVASEQLLLTFTNIRNKGPNKIFDMATVATANMAAKMGGDASGAAIQLGKALNDPVKGISALSRVGVSFTAGQKKSIEAMVKSGDVMGAQKIILKELNTEFGGAAKAAGQSLPGQLAIAKRSFEDLSQSIVTMAAPAFSTIVTGVTGFIKGMQDGTGAGGTFRDILTTIYDKGLKPVGEFIVGTMVPAIQKFVTEFQNGEGAGGKFRDILQTIYDKALVPLADFITGTALPALGSIATWITGTGIPALSTFKDWVIDNRDTLKVLAEFIGVVLIPVFADMAVKAVASAATQAGAWVTTQVAGGTSALAQLGSHYVIVGGWVMSAAAAVASGAETVAIWALYKAEAIAGAASTVASLATVAAGWVASKVTAAAQAALTAAAWVASTAGVVAAWVTAKAGMVAEWVASAAKAVVHAVAVAASWVASVAGVVAAWVVTTAAVIADWVALKVSAGINAVLVAASWVASVAGVVAVWGTTAAAIIADWVAMRVAASASAISMAASWVVAAGPIAWVIGWFVALGAMVKKVTDEAGSAGQAWGNIWGGVKATISFVVNDIKVILGSLGTFMIQKGKDVIQGLLNGMKSAPGAITDAIASIGNQIINAVKDFFGIHSPSTVMAGMGGHIVTGLINGIIKTKGLAGAMSKVFGNVKGGILGLIEWVASNGGNLLEKLGIDLPSFGGGGSGGSGVAQWSGLVTQALAMLGQPLSLVSTVLRRMNQESGGNPMAINNWDSNAAMGDPSRGLMQTIGSTFNAYRLPGLSANIYDPLSNIVASMRYALANYGSLSSAYNRSGGYALGTNNAAPGWSWVGERGPELKYFNGGETVIPNDKITVGGSGSGNGDVVDAIKSLGDRFGTELDRQARTIQTLQQQMVGAR